MSFTNVLLKQNTELVERLQCLEDLLNRPVDAWAHARALSDFGSDSIMDIFQYNSITHVQYKYIITDILTTSLLFFLYNTILLNIEQI